MTEKIKSKSKINRKLSIAIGLLSFGAFVISQLGETWGFEAVAKQIAQTALIFSGGINIYFGGTTVQKNIEEKNDKNS